MSDDEIVATLSKQSEQIQQQLSIAQKSGAESTKELLDLLKIIKNEADACASKSQPAIVANKENVNALQQKLTVAQKSEFDRLQEKMRLAQTNSTEANKKIADLESQIALCEASRKTVTAPGGLPQLEQIRKLEQQRLASNAEAVVLRKERDAMEEKLEKFVATVDRIAQLRKKCAIQGKSLADEIGEANALKINDLETLQKSNVTLQQQKVDNARNQLKTIEERLAEAYEQECLLRDEQQKSSERMGVLEEEKFQLQKQWQDEQAKLASTLNDLTACQTQQKEISTALSQAETDLKALESQFEKLYQSDLSLKKSQEQLKQQVTELQQENNLLEKDKRQLKDSIDNNATNMTNANSVQQEWQRERQQLINDNNELRDQLKTLGQQLASYQKKLAAAEEDNANLLAQNRDLDKQLTSVSEQSLLDFRKREELEAENVKLKADLKVSIEEAAEAGALGKTLLDRLMALQASNQ